MVNRFRHIAAIILLLTYSFTAIGFAFSVHYCHASETVSYGILDEPNTCCDDEIDCTCHSKLNTCSIKTNHCDAPNHEEHEMITTDGFHCCEHNTHYIKIIEDYSQPENNHGKRLKNATFLLTGICFSTIKDTLSKRNHSFFIYSKILHPPNEREIITKHCSLLL